jgi:hypothetical protein
MRGTGFKKFNSENREIVLLQANVESAFSQNIVSGLNNGILLENVELESGDNSVNHKLGRKIKGALVVAGGDGATIYNKILTDTELETKFTVNASADCTVNLWVF